MKGSSLLLFVIFIMMSASLYISYTNYQQIQLLHHENRYLLEKIDSVQHLSTKKTQKKSSVSSISKTTPATPEPRTNAVQTKPKAATAAKTVIIVSTKYRLEDRYVKSSVRLPEYKGNEVGEVVLDVIVNRWGEVKTAKLQSVTGITDEEVIEACKKAALRTSFNSNYDHPDNKSGTIIYIFSAK